MYKALSAPALGIDLPIEQVVPLARKHGFEGIYFDVRWAAKAGPRKAREALDGLKPAAFGLPFVQSFDFFLPPASASERAGTS